MGPPDPAPSGPAAAVVETHRAGGGAVSPPGEEVELVGRCPSLAAIRLTVLGGEGARPKIPGDKDPGLLCEVPYPHPFLSPVGPSALLRCGQAPLPGQSCCPMGEPQQAHQLWPLSLNVLDGTEPVCRGQTGLWGGLLGLPLSCPHLAQHKRPHRNGN